MEKSDEEYEDALKGVFKKGKKKSILDQVTVIEPEVNPRYARDAARLEEYAAQGMNISEALFAYCQENRKQRGEE